jgi:hypothetical protein
MNWKIKPIEATTKIFCFSSFAFFIRLPIVSHAAFLVVDNLHAKSESRLTLNFFFDVTVFIISKQSCAKRFLVVAETLLPVDCTKLRMVKELEEQTENKL